MCNHIVVDYHPQKDKPNCTRLRVGGDIISYPADVNTPTYDTNTVNILYNNVVSTPKAKYMYIDIFKNHLGKPLTKYEYLLISIILIPDAIIHQYNLLPLSIRPPPPLSRAIMKKHMTASSPDR